MKRQWWFIVAICMMAPVCTICQTCAGRALNRTHVCSKVGCKSSHCSCNSLAIITKGGSVLVQYAVCCYEDTITADLSLRTEYANLSYACFDSSNITVVMGIFLHIGLHDTTNYSFEGNLTDNATRCELNLGYEDESSSENDGFLNHTLHCDVPPPPPPSPSATSSITPSHLTSTPQPFTSMPQQTPTNKPSSNTGLSIQIGEIAALAVMLVILSLCLPVLVMSSCFIFFRYRHSKALKRDSFIEAYIEEEACNYEPKLDLLGMPFSLTFDTVSEIIEFGTHLPGEGGTHQTTTEDIKDCDEYSSDDTDSNSTGNIHRHGSYDGYLNVCEDYEQAVGNARTIPTLNHHSNIETKCRRTIGRDSTAIHTSEKENQLDCSICTMEDDPIECMVAEDDEISFDYKTSTERNLSPLRQASSSNNDSGIDI